MVNIIDVNGNEKAGGGPQTAKAMPTNPTNTGLGATNVDDSLKELNSKLSSYDITTNTGYTTDGKAYADNKIAFIYPRINASSQMSSGTTYTIGTIPAQLKPVRNSPLVVANEGIWEVNTNCELKFTPSASVQYVGFNAIIVYPLG